MRIKVAALYVSTGGTYFGILDVDPWDEPRDARLYAGPWPVVAHPPCARWCQLAGLVQARWGHKIGDDGGCFGRALRVVRRFGGVLEHPAYSKAWKAYGLERPKREGGWTVSDRWGGSSAQVEQGRYGHAAKKATWLYAVSAPLPELRWGCSADSKEYGLVSWCGNHTKVGDKRRRLSSKEAAATPPAFRDVLLAIARDAHG